MKMTRESTSSEYENIVASKELAQSFVDENLPGYAIQSVPGDGSCLLRAFSVAMNSIGENVELTDVKSKLKEEMNGNHTFYRDFHDIDGNILEELERYLESPMTYYNGDLTDLYLYALGNAFKVNLSIVKSNSEKCWIEELIPSSDSTRQDPTLHFLKTLSEHIDPIIKRQEQNLCSDEVNEDNVEMGYHSESSEDCVITHSVPSSSVPSSKVKPEIIPTDHDDNSNSQIQFSITEPFDYDSPTAASLIQRIVFQPEAYKKDIAPKGMRKNSFYTILSKSFNEATTDDNGAYFSSRSNKKCYYAEVEGDTVMNVKTAHLSNNSYYVTERNGKEYDMVEVEKNNIYEIERYYRKNKSNPCLKRMIVRIKTMWNDLRCPYIGVVYSLSESLDDDIVEILPHGNATKKGYRPYIRTSKETLNREKELLEAGNSITSVYETVLDEAGGPLLSESQSREPRDMRQIYSQNANRKRRLQNNSEDGTADDLSSMIQKLNSLGVVRSITINQKCYFYFVATDRQLNDISKFCCEAINPSVFGIDTTFNLCELWVTDSCYRNHRIVSNVSNSHPVYLGPSLFHFTKDNSTFTRFALEIQAALPDTRALKKIGVDMEDAIYNGVKILFPEAQQLYCVRHLQQRDVTKIDELLGEVNCSDKEKSKAKKEILLDIYGERKGSLYEYGLAESADEEEFKRKLETLEKKWESRCKGFYNWFCSNRKQLFVTSVICSAREGTNLSGLYYQNDIESQHFVEKVRQCYEKKSVEEAIRNFERMIQHQDNEEIRALYGAGSFRLSTSYQNFKVDSARWHNWDPETRRKHILKFRSYQPSLGDTFVRPKNAGRKPNCHQRSRRPQEPDILVDRLENGNEEEEGIRMTISKSPSSNTWHASAPQSQAQSLRFQDPDQEQGKAFELHLRKDLPKLVKKCQGQCGKQITDKCFLLVKSFGTIHWTDNSGNSCSRFGPMYIHFDRKCLEQFDTEESYGPSKRFDYSRITVAEKCKQQLKSDEKQFLTNLGIQF